MVQRAERVVHLLAHYRMAKHTHQVVAEHGYPQRRLCRPEVPQYETAQSKVSLSLLAQEESVIRCDDALVEHPPRRFQLRGSEVSTIIGRFSGKATRERLPLT